MIIAAVLLILGLVVGTALGVLVTNARQQVADTRRRREEEALAEREELYVAWAALKAAKRRPTE
jgi:hypothetical protein